MFPGTPTCKGLSDVPGIMGDKVLVRRMLEGRLFMERRKGRPRLRWLDDVLVDLKIMKIRQWVEAGC
jgi:hypothetical protein